MASLIRWHGLFEIDFCSGEVKFLTEKADGQFKKTASNAKLRQDRPIFSHYIQGNRTPNVLIRSNSRLLIACSFLGNVVLKAVFFQALEINW